MKQVNFLLSMVCIVLTVSLAMGAENFDIPQPGTVRRTKAATAKTSSKSGAVAAFQVGGKKSGKNRA
jgi:hypothetical protein